MRRVELNQQVGHTQAFERQARATADAAASLYWIQSEELTQQLHLAAVRERQAISSADATTSEVQSALAVAGADSAMKFDEIRTQIIMESNRVSEARC